MSAIGDCDLDGVVGIDELILGVSMALGGQPFAACPAIDADGNGMSSVDEVIRAVAASLRGCPERYGMKTVDVLANGASTSSARTVGGPKGPSVRPELVQGLLEPQELTP